MPSGGLKDKAVLFGHCASSGEDSGITAVDHVNEMFYTEMHANAVQALLDGDFKDEAGDNAQMPLLFALLLFACAAFWKRGVRTSTAAWIALCAGWVLFCKLAYGAGLIFYVLYVPACVTILYAGFLAANYMYASRARKQVSGMFERYVAPEIFSEFMKAPEASKSLGGRLCDVAVLFVDVRGFTAMSADMALELVIEILNRYLGLISDYILAHGGTLDKYVGNAAMAFWGAPLPQEDYVMNAARAAMDMAAGAKSLSDELYERYGRELTFGIGLHVGEAVIGNIGSPRRMDYTAIGDTVNTAARLESAAPGGTIYISRAFADALEGRIEATPLEDPPYLKGKPRGFEILTLDAILDGE